MTAIKREDDGEVAEIEGEAEQAAFTENAIRYQASIQFLSSKVKGLKLALRGE